MTYTPIFDHKRLESQDSKEVAMEALIEEIGFYTHDEKLRNLICEHLEEDNFVNVETFQGPHVLEIEEES